MADMAMDMDIDFSMDTEVDPEIARLQAEADAINAVRKSVHPSSTRTTLTEVDTPTNENHSVLRRQILTL